MKKYGPIDARQSPRFCGVASFMRLPHITTTEDVDVAFIGIPFDTATTHRVGSRFAPAEIRENSRLLRPYNPAQEIDIFEYCSAVDYGDADVVPGYIERTYERIVETMRPIFDAGVIPIAMGGDHSITLPIFRALATDGPIGMIHLDAHTDTWDEFMGSRSMHGTPFRRAVEEDLLDPERTVQIGIRGAQGTTEGWDYSAEKGMRVIFMDEFAKIGVDEVIAEARRVVGDGATYISFDIDALDPAFAPGTGTPEIGGLTSLEAQTLLRGLRGLNLVGADVVEVAPPFDPSGNTALVAATLMYEILCLLAEVVACEMLQSV